MFILDTNVVCETRRTRANGGVRIFFDRIKRNKTQALISVVTVAELRQGVENLRHRRDDRQAAMYETWVTDVLQQYDGRILPVDKEIGKVWGRLRVPQREPALDKLIAATALVHGMTIVTRNVKDFAVTGAKTFNPFE
jgi:toxin FitB